MNLSRRAAATLIVAALILSALACDDDSTPTETFTVLDTFTGTWSGSVTSAPAEVDWDPMDLVLTQSGSSVRGAITNASGEAWPVEGLVTLEPTSVGLEVDGFAIPEGACFDVGLWFSEFERAGEGQIIAMSGLITGRCFGTLMTPIRLQRTGL